MFGAEKPPMITYDAPKVGFHVGGKQIAEAPLSRLRRFILVFCFEPFPGPEPDTFTVLDFGDAFWLVSDLSALNHLRSDWLSPIKASGAFYEANAGQLPPSWRAKSLLLFRNPYLARPTVVPAQPTPFLDMEGPLAPENFGRRGL